MASKKKFSDESNRPSIYDPLVFNELEERLLIGEAVQSILYDLHMPSRIAFYRCLRNHNHTFGDRLRSAREFAQEADVDAIITIADSATPSNWQAQKLKVNSRQWRASKLYPTKFGDLAVLNAKNNLTDAVTRVIIENDPEHDDDGDETEVQEVPRGTEEDL